jgi:DNA repair exonuclease SbcCD ATPase subunit
MRIESYEQLKANLTAQAAKRQEDDAKLAAAAAEVAAAKKRYGDLLEQAAASGDSDELAVEVSKAQGAVLIAEKRQKMLEEQLGSVQPVQGVSGATSRVSGEIRRLLGDGTILAELQPALDELDTIRAQYLDKVREVLHARARINRELRDIQQETQSLEQQATGSSPGFGIMGPAQLDLDALRKWVWLWMYDDLGEVTRRLENEAYEAANGPGYTGQGVAVRDKITLPPAAQPETYQYQTQVIGRPLQ